MNPANELRRLPEFQSVLANYRMSETSLKTLEKTKLVLLTGPSSVGRNTIIQELIQTGRYYFIVSDTTRRPRTNRGVAEQNGVEYWFRGEADVLNDLRAGKLIGPAIIHNQQVSGISTRELEKAQAKQQIAITDFEIIGASKDLILQPNVICIFVLPPSLEEWQRRFASRSTFTEAEKQHRLSDAPVELSLALNESDILFTVNDELGDGVRQVDELVKALQVNEAEQKTRRRLAQTLLTQIKSLTKSTGDH